MAILREVGCINKSDRNNPHEHILNIGGVDSLGVRWKRSQAQAIEDIESYRYGYYVRKGGSTVDVIVAVSQHGNKYLKTRADGEKPDNLLSLPECPPA